MDKGFLTYKQTGWRDHQYQKLHPARKDSTPRLNAIDSSHLYLDYMNHRGEKKTFKLNPS
jgi:hypothetical protein